MALDNLLEVYDENGVKQDYDILADDVKFQPDGKDLPTKLSEMQQSIDEAGQVNEIVMNGEHYTPKNKVIDLGTVVGEQGPQGEQGEQGPKGDKGDKGDEGMSAYEVAVVEGFHGDEQAWLASLKGAKGDTGAKGDKGDTGSKGDKGDTGETGAQGEKGEKGDKGDTGETGPAGPQGNSGVASADSIESVNNLNGAPADTASKVYVLGANMGRELAGYLSAPSPVSLDGLTSVNAIIAGSNGKWVENYGVYTCVFLPIVAGATYIVKAGSIKADVAVLVDNDHTNGQTPHYASGQSAQIIIPAGETSSILMPLDAVYMHILTYTDGGDCTPSVSVEQPVSVKQQIRQSIVNNLTEGGEEKALSAEMGKFINGNFGPQVKLNLSIYPKGKAIIGGQGTWTASWQKFKSLFIPVVGGNLYVFDSPSLINGAFCILTDNVVTPGSTPHYATGETGRRNLQVGKTQVTMPNDAAYIFSQWDSEVQDGPMFSIYSVIDSFYAAVNDAAVSTVVDIASFDLPLYLRDIGTREGGKWIVESVVKIPVRRGDVLHCNLAAASGSPLVTFYETYGGAGEVLLSGVGDEAPINIDVPIAKDGYVYVRGVYINANPPTCTIATTAPPADELVVAAANTPSNVKCTAGYVCTGTNDEVIINDMLFAAAVLGMCIKLLPGDYYLDAPTKTYKSENDAFLLAETRQKSIVIYGDNAGIGARPVLHISNTAYEALDDSKYYSLLAVYDSDNYGGYFEMKNIEIRYPSNQKRICAIDLMWFGGYARLHSIAAWAWTNGYNSQNYSFSSPPPVSVDGCIGIRFIGKGPNGSYGSEITDCTLQGFYEGVTLNTEWTVCNHVVAIFCYYGWVFGKYGATGQAIPSVRCHPMVLINCGDERNVNLPLFHHNSGAQSIEMIAFDIERVADATPGGVLGDMAKETTPGSFRGEIHYSVGQVSNSVNKGFWEYGHGHGMRTTDMSQLQTGPTSTRNGYRPNYMQRYFDTTLGKEVICIDEEHGTWVDAMGNQV